MFEVAFTLLVLCSLMQSYFWLWQMRIPQGCEPKEKRLSPKVSLVIAVKNERANLEKHLRKWDDQEYEDYEIVLIDDHSTDGTFEYLNQYESPRLIVLRLPIDQSGKKNAVSLGIKSSNSAWIVLTDADCYPQSRNWLAILMDCAHTSDLILGISPYEKNAGFLGKWINFETWYIAVQYLSAALRNRPFMGVGRNMAFKKSLFTIVGGYSKHQNLPSGNDDLFISALPKKTRIRWSLNVESWMWSIPEKSWGDLIRQKTRHVSTAPSYRWNIQLWLIMIFISHGLFYICLFYLLTTSGWVAIFWIFRMLMITTVINRSSPLKAMRPNLLWLPVMDFFQVVFYALLSFSFVSPKKDW